MNYNNTVLAACSGSIVPVAVVFVGCTAACLGRAVCSHLWSGWGIWVTRSEVCIMQFSCQAGILLGAVLGLCVRLVVLVLPVDVILDTTAD